MGIWSGEARNTGGEAAAELGVEGSAQIGGTVETSDTTFDFLPPDSVREGGLFFSGDPRGSLTLRVLATASPDCAATPPERCRPTTVEGEFLGFLWRVRDL